MALPDAEGLLIAMEMERRGVALYRRAARLSERPEARALFERLMADEQQHGQTFEARYRALAAREPEAARGAGPDSDRDAESAAYHTALAAEVMLPDGLVGLGLATGFDDPAAILRRAIEAEEDAVRFYTDMAGSAADGAARRTFTEIAEEERGHKRELTERLKEGLA